MGSSKPPPLTKTGKIIAWAVGIAIGGPVLLIVVSSLVYVCKIILLAVFS
jgi:hypothetical protein